MTQALQQTRRNGTRRVGQCWYGGWLVSWNTHDGMRRWQMQSSYNMHRETLLAQHNNQRHSHTHSRVQPCIQTRSPSRQHAPVHLRLAALCRLSLCKLHTGSTPGLATHTLLKEPAAHGEGMRLCDFCEVCIITRHQQKWVALVPLSQFPCASLF
jgi:hypothetical protein